MDYAALKTLMETHPQWPTVDDAALTTWVNEETVSVDKDTVSSGAIFAAILNNRDEWQALSASDREFVKDILYIHSGEGVPTAAGTPARTQLIAILGASTRQELAATISTLVSRASAAGIPGTVRQGDVEFARTM